MKNFQDVSEVFDYFRCCLLDQHWFVDFNLNNFPFSNQILHLVLAKEPPKPKHGGHSPEHHSGGKILKKVKEKKSVFIFFQDTVEKVVMDTAAVMALTKAEDMIAPVPVRNPAAANRSKINYFVICRN